MFNPDNYFQFFSNKKMGIKDEDDNIILPAVYDHIELDGDAYFTVSRNGYTAYFDVQGAEVLPFQNNYDNYGSFNEGLALVRSTEKYGYINISGEEVIPLQFHFAHAFSGSHAIIRDIDGKHGMIDQRGNLVIPCKYTFLFPFKNGYAKFGNFNNWGLLNKDGIEVVPQIYNQIDVLEGNKATVRILERNNWQEGILTIGGDVVWNNNMQAINAHRQKLEIFRTYCESWMANMYGSGCPCVYLNFRKLIEWDNYFVFIDQEILYTALLKWLTSHPDNSNTMICAKCKTQYHPHIAEINAFSQVLQVTVTLPNEIPSTPASDEKIPFVMGFQQPFDKEYALTRYKESTPEDFFRFIEK